MLVASHQWPQMLPRSLEPMRLEGRALASCFAAIRLMAPERCEARATLMYLLTLAWTPIAEVPNLSGTDADALPVPVAKREHVGRHRRGRAQHQRPSTIAEERCVGLSLCCDHPIRRTDCVLTPFYW